MRKTLRLLDWIVNDIDEAKKKLEAVESVQYIKRTNLLMKCSDRW